MKALFNFISIFPCVLFLSCNPDEDSGSSANTNNAGNNNGGGNGSATAASHSCGEEDVHNTALNYGTLTDQQGNTYKTIIIGGNEWMAENLETTKFRNGEQIPNVTGSSEWWEAGAAWCYYNNNSEYNCPYGKLYNWGAVEDSRGLCPTGWHVPSTSEWNNLFANFGGSNSAGNELTSAGDNLWFDNPTATNSSGLSIIPNGFREGTGTLGFAWSLSFDASFWTSTESPPFYSTMVMFDGGDDIDFRDTHPQDGAAIRCKRD
jgi:uncharacterized protein (TIGR02145 family)